MSLLVCYANTRQDDGGGLTRNYSCSHLSPQIVHILPEATHVLEDVTEFPLAATLLLAGLLLAYAFEVLPGHIPHDHVRPSSTAELTNTISPPANSSTLVLVQPNPFHPPVLMAVPSAATAPESSPPKSAGEGAAVDAEMGKMEITSTRAAVESIEFGCVAHSIILGLSLGLQRELSTATNLLIVFLLHQWLEAICLSHLIASLNRRLEALIMCTLTVLSNCNCNSKGGRFGVHEYIRTYTHTYLHTYLHTYTHTHTHTYIHTVIAEQVTELEEHRVPNLSTLSYALSPSLTNISTTSVKMSVMDCSDYSTPGEMLAEAIEYPCAFVNMEGCNYWG